MNYNPNAKRILVFGDSLSWGYIPGTNHERHPANVRWPGKLQELLGNDYEIIEETLNSRGIENGDSRPGKEGRVALDYVEPCLDSHDPLDLVIVMLGGHELKYEYNNSAQDVGNSMERLLKIIASRPSQFRKQRPKILLLAPTVINENAEYCKKGDKYKGATQKSIDLAEVYKNLAENLKINYASIQDTAQPGIDGAHLDKISQIKVANFVYDVIAKIL